MHFPANAGLIFLTDELTNDKFLVVTGATLSIIPCSSNNPSGPLLKGNQSPLGVSSPKLSCYKAKCSLPAFASSRSQSHSGPILGINFLRKFKITVAQETSQFLFACAAAAPPAKPFLPSFAQFSTATPALPVPPDSSPPPSLPVRVSQVKSSNSSSKGNQSMFDPHLSVLPVAEPTSMHPIPDSVPADVKCLLQK
jgi:hypothetical protein